MTLSRISILFFILLFHISPAEELSPPSLPWLEPAYTMHSGRLGRPSVDRSGVLALTCSFDKTAKLWDLTQGKLLRTLYPPAAPSIEGRLYCSALSPDGAAAAVSGLTGYLWEKRYCIYLFDVRSGEMSGRIRGFTAPVSEMRFSPDGTLLAACLLGKKGVWICDAQRKSVVKKLEGYAGDCIACEFDPLGRILITADTDKMIRCYSFERRGLRISIRKRADTRVPFIPSDIVTGKPGNDPVACILPGRGSSVLFLDARTLKPEGTYDFQVDDASFMRGTLLAGSSMVVSMLRTGHKPYSELFILDMTNKRRSYACALPPVLDLQSCGTRSFLYSCFEREWGTMSAGGRTLCRFRQQDPISYRVLSLTLDNAGTLGLQTGDGYDCSWPVRALLLKVKRMQQGIAPRWVSGDSVIARDRSGVVRVTASGDAVYIYKNGVFTRQLRLTAGAAAIAVAPDTLTCAVATDDGVVAWYSLSDGGNLLNICFDSAFTRWAAWTPDGYWDASSDGDRLLGWRMNRGIDSSGILSEAAPFLTMRRPEMLAAALEPKRGAVGADSLIEDMSMPKVTIRFPRRREISDTIVHVRYDIAAKKRTPRTASIELTVNGIRQTPIYRGISVVNHKDLHRTIVARIRPGDNMIELKARCGNRVGPSSVLRLNCIVPLRPDLFFLSVGVRKTEAVKQDIFYAENDALSFTDLIRRNARNTGFPEVSGRILTGEESTADSILANLRRIKNRCSRSDLVILFFAGHGFREKGRLYFGTAVQRNNPSARASIPFRELRRELDNIQARMMCFIDCCHSGAIIGESKYRDDHFYFCSSQPGQLSQEQVAWQHGAFTQALLEFFVDPVNSKGQSALTLRKLEDYLGVRVPVLTGGAQKPVFSPALMNDLSIFPPF